MLHSCLQIVQHELWKYACLGRTCIQIERETNIKLNIKNMLAISSETFAPGALLTLLHVFIGKRKHL